jgi:hypothetical protein
MIGPYTLRVTGPSEDELDIKALEERIKQAEKSLADLKAKLDVLKAKKKQ